MSEECIPVVCVPPCLLRGPPQCMLRYPQVWTWKPTPGCEPGDPPPGVSLETPQVWGWRPPRCGPVDPPGQTPQLTPWVLSWRPPRTDPSTPPLGVGLETCKACWDTTPETCKACWDTTCIACWDTTPPVDRILDTRF